MNSQTTSCLFARAACGLLAFAGLLLGAGQAFAGAGVIVTTVSRITDNVTYSRPATTKIPALDMYIAYSVTVANAGGNTINNIRFTAQTAVADAEEKAVFASSEGANCAVANAEGTAIDCSIGQLTAGVAYPSFVIYFKSPQKKVNGIYDDDNSDSVTLTGRTWYAEGTGGLDVSPNNSYVDLPLDGTLDVTLGTSNPSKIRSAVRKEGGQIFTGDAVPTGTDPWTTEVRIPANGVGYSTAEILETVGVANCTSELLTCNATNLDIPGTFASLTIYLRRDASTIPKAAKIANAKIYYSHTNLTYESPTTSGVLTLQACTPAGPSLGIPCISKRTEFTKRTAPTPDYEGDWEIEIKALDNGRFLF